MQMPPGQHHFTSQPNHVRWPQAACMPICLAHDFCHVPSHTAALTVTCVSNLISHNAVQYSLQNGCLHKHAVRLFTCLCGAAKRFMQVGALLRLPWEGGVLGLVMRLHSIG